MVHFSRVAVTSLPSTWSTIVRLLEQTPRITMVQTGIGAAACATTIGWWAALTNVGATRPESALLFAGASVATAAFLGAVLAAREHRPTLLAGLLLATAVLSPLSMDQLPNLELVPNAVTIAIALLVGATADISPTSQGTAR